MGVMPLPSVKVGRPEILQGVVGETDPEFMVSSKLENTTVELIFIVKV